MFHWQVSALCFSIMFFVTRQHESGDVFTLYAGSDAFSLYYVGQKGPPATHRPSKEFGLSMIMQY